MLRSPRPEPRHLRRGDGALIRGRARVRVRVWVRIRVRSRVRVRVRLRVRVRVRVIFCCSARPASTLVVSKRWR